MCSTDSFHRRTSRKPSYAYIVYVACCRKYGQTAGLHVVHIMRMGIVARRRFARRKEAHTPSHIDASAVGRVPALTCVLIHIRTCACFAPFPCVSTRPPPVNLSYCIVEPRFGGLRFMLNAFARAAHVLTRWVRNHEIAAITNHQPVSQTVAFGAVSSVATQPRTAAPTRATRAAPTMIPTWALEKVPCSSAGKIRCLCPKRGLSALPYE